MRKALPLILIFIMILLVEVSSAQKVEVTAGISGNLYNYSGNLSRSQIDYYSSAAADYIDYPPYSKSLTAGYGADLKLQYIHKAGFILGVALGYDITRSKINSSVTYIANPSATPPAGGYQPDATGYTLTSTKQIHANPYVGYRVTAKKFSVDLQLGAEVAFLVENKERRLLAGKFQSDNTIYYPNKNTLNNSEDYRLKAGIAINYHKFAINFSYAHGVSNFYKDGSFLPNSSQYTLYSQLLKTGVSYRLF